MFETQLDFMNS